MIFLLFYTYFKIRFKVSKIIYVIYYIHIKLKVQNMLSKVNHSLYFLVFNFLSFIIQRLSVKTNIFFAYARVEIKN